MTSKNKKTALQETPLMVQYNAIKAKYRDTVLFFRMGDFYEMFNEDAKLGSRVLGITLTSRGHGKAGDVPLAGFPYHALDEYLSRMVRAGHRVAICEQVEDPKLAKGIVKRDVVQVVTPGTVSEERILEARRNNYLSAVALTESLCGLATADVSTGEFLVTEVESGRLCEELMSLNPSEILVAEGSLKWLKEEILNNGSGPMVTRMEDWYFSRDYGYDLLINHFGTKSLKGFDCEDLNAGLGAAGAVLNYIQETQKTDVSYIRKLRRYRERDYMHLDSATRRNLELTSAMIGGGREGSLLSILDRTRTAMGGRTLANWLNRPMLKKKSIEYRLDGVEALLQARAGRIELTQQMKTMGDIERLITRIVTRRASPRDLKALKNTLEVIPGLQKEIEGIPSTIIASIGSSLDPCEDVTDLIKKAIVDDPPLNFTNGGIIREGYHPELDEYRSLAYSGKDWIARLQNSERESTGISTLKVGFNRVFGYYIEVTKANLARVPETYIRKQTLVNAERFITPELKEMEEKILKAEEKLRTLELQLFESIRDSVAERAEAIQENGLQVGMLDALVSLATVAEEFKYTKPRVHEKASLAIEDGRHPVVEQLLPPGDPFIPNDVILNSADQQILIITGPNMAGKSTFIRQVGLIVLLAQIGSYVPAEKAEIGIADRIFTRVGAQDNVAGGESTFLVEMNETANILNNATPESLILLDEIGRGTSTFDGLSIAWAVAEYLHDHEQVAARTLFATHYHELTELALILPRIKNYNVAVKEWGDNIVFLRKIVPGGCDHSYGIQVARLAGLPKSVIDRAKEVLANLEENELTPNALPKLAIGKHGPMMVAQPQLNIFSEEVERLKELLKSLDLDNIAPLEALKILYELKKSVSNP